MRLAVIGLGKLGLCTAACFASKGHGVRGYDVNVGLGAALARGECPIDETGLAALLKNCGSRFSVSTSVAAAVSDAETVLIIVPTPSQSDGTFDNSYVERALMEIGDALRAKSDFTVICVVSTVMPGSTEGQFKPLLEERSGKQCGRDFGLVYNPEFIALGSVVRDFLNPDMVLIGASDERSGAHVQALYHSTVDSKPYFAVMSPTNAEIAKLSLNCYVTMKISFANELASLCERVPGADVDAITQALGADSRIGNNYLKGGMGFGGPCFPRDNAAYAAFAAHFGGQARLGAQVVAVNHHVVERVIGAVKTNVKAGEKVLLLGMSYKPGTAVSEESQGVQVAQGLARAGYRVVVHDPKAMANVRAALGERVSYAADVTSGAKEVAAVVVLTLWPEYDALDFAELGRVALPTPLFLDCWRHWKRRPLSKWRYVGLGMGVQ